MELLPLNCHPRDSGDLRCSCKDPRFRGDDLIGHEANQITFASFLSLSTSVATSGTITPPLRLPGSATLSVLRRGVTSTPSASGVSVSSGFFFAFMILGSVA